jgi:hypothetical protein
MKKLISFTGLVIFLLALLSTSCKKDEEVNLLIGTWNVSYFSQVTYLNGEKYEGSETIDLLDPGDMTLKIFDDGTGEEWEIGALNDTFTWVLDGAVITVTTGGAEPMEIEMTYIVTDTRLVLIGTVTDTIESDIYEYTQTMVATRAIN